MTYTVSNGTLNSTIHTYTSPCVDEALLQVAVDCAIVSELMQQPVDTTLILTFVEKLHRKLTSVISFQLTQTFI